MYNILFALCEINILPQSIPRTTLRHRISQIVNYLGQVRLVVKGINNHIGNLLQIFDLKYQ